MTNTGKLEVLVQTANQQNNSGFCTIKVTLLNIGTETITVNKRMAIGYKDNFERELFLELFDDSGNEITHLPKVDYNRNTASKSDFIKLIPGDSVSRKFDLLEWYPIQDSGKYWLRVHYQADEAMTNFPQEVLKGIHSAKRIELLLNFTQIKTN